MKKNNCIYRTTMVSHKDVNNKWSYYGKIYCRKDGVTFIQHVSGNSIENLMDNMRAHMRTL